MIIGETVKVLDSGKSYSRYNDWAKLMNIEHWFFGDNPTENKEYTLKAIKNHLRFTDRQLAWIEDKETGQGYIINTNALEQVMLSKDLFIIE